MRCTTLALAWKQAKLGPAKLVGEMSVAFVRERIECVGVSSIPTHLAAWNGAVSLTDHYDDNVRAQGAARSEAALRVLVDDEGGLVPPGYDVVINPNPYATAALYPGFRGVFIGGPEAVLIRDDLPTTSGGIRTAVMFGGGGPQRWLLDVLRGVARRDRLQERWIGVGPWCPPEWQQVATDFPWRELATCGRVILAAGGAAWEAAAVGVPVVLLEVAANQHLVTSWATRHAVPALNAMTSSRAHELDGAIEAALSTARPLPRVASGASSVARLLAHSAMSFR